MKTTLPAVLCLSMLSCSPIYADSQTKIAPALTPAPAAPTARTAPAKAIPKAVVVNERSAAKEFPDLAPAASIAPVASDPASDVPWQYQVVMVLISFLSLLLTAMVPVVAKYLVKKYKLDVTESEASLWDDVVIKAIDATEERAHQVLKTNLPPMTSDAKRDNTVMNAIAAADARGLPQKTVVEIVKLAESHLGATR